MGRGGIFSPAHEAWRNHPKLNGNMRKLMPGFGNAVAIFSTYCVLEFIYNKISPPQHALPTSKEEFEFPRYEGAYKQAGAAEE